MEELFNILSEGKVHVRVEMDAADLKAFSDELIRRAKDELGSMVEAARKERMLSKAEVKAGLAPITITSPPSKPPVISSSFENPVYSFSSFRS